jgi:hypothetical protein
MEARVIGSGSGRSLDAARKRRQVPRAAGSRVLLLVVLGGSGLALGVEGPQGVSSCEVLSVPALQSEALDLVYDGEVVDPVRAFRARYGSAWTLYWDSATQTLRYLAPRHEFQLVGTSPQGGGLEASAVESAVRGFVDANRELFGLEASELSLALAEGLGVDRLLVFHQTAGGLPVRGATIRVVVTADGRLLAIKSYVGRGLTALWESKQLGALRLLGVEDVLPAALGSGKVVSRARLELVFPEGAIDSIWPVWSFWTQDDSEATLEEVRDAVTGALWISCPVSKHFDYSGDVSALSADTVGVFSQPDEILARPQGLRGIVLSNDAGQLLGVTSSSGDGAFAVMSNQNPETILASLAYSSGVTTCGRYETTTCAGRSDCIEMQVRPLLSDSPSPCAGCVPAELDFNAECIPDVAHTSTPLDDFHLVLNQDILAAGDLATAEAVSWWVLLYAQAERLLRTFRPHLAGQDSMFERYDRLDVIPVGLADAMPIAALEWRPYSEFEQHPRKRGAVVVKRFAHAPGVAAVPLMASLVGHEVAHHVIYQATCGVEHSEVEEGVADALVAIANDEPRIGWLREDDSGPFGFVLGDVTPFVSVLRSQVGRGLYAFWDLCRRSPARLESRALDVVCRWLVANRAVDPNDRAFLDHHCLLDELLDANERVPLRNDDSARAFEETAELLLTAFADPVFHQGQFFVRGDANLDAAINISDPIHTLDALFGGNNILRLHDCADAMDTDDNGAIEISDAIRVLRYLFMGGPAPVRPFPACGQDPDLNDELCCREAPSCPLEP